jgi:hypothetical protein
MTTTNIGSCGCCGGASPCPCSTISVCYWEWDGTTWQPLGGANPNPCDGVDEFDRSRSPCCECPGPPLYDGTQVGETGTRYCQANPNETSVCSCFQCVITWDSFLQEWTPGTCLGPDGQTGAYTCNCPTDFPAGTTHGEQISNVICGCAT